MPIIEEGFDKQPLPFMAASFIPGQSQPYIDTLMDKELKLLAECERHYYRGEGEQCVTLARKLLKSPSFPIHASAALMFTFGSLCAGDPKSAMETMIAIRQEYELKIAQSFPRPKVEKVYAAFLNNLATVLLHLEGNPFVEMDVTQLPEGVRMIAFYVLAHRHYLQGEYGQAVGVCETALSLCGKPYPVGEVYLHLIACVAYMNLHEQDKATAHFLKAWDIAKPEGFIEPFSEHHGLLQGMIEIHLRKAEPESYERIIRQVYVFAGAWRQVHNPETNHLVADNLSTIEFTVAMLASKGWNNNRIADHVGISVNTVRSHIASVYQKLQISSRKQLHQYMLK